MFKRLWKRRKYMASHPYLLKYCRNPFPYDTRVIFGVGHYPVSIYSKNWVVQ